MSMFNHFSCFIKCVQLRRLILRTVAVLTKETTCVALSRVGWNNQKIVALPLEKLVDIDIGPPLHCLVIAGKLHPLEEDFIKQFVP